MSEVVDMEAFKERGYFVRLPRGESEIRLKQIITELVENPRPDPVLVDFMSYTGASKQVRQNRNRIPYWNSIQLGGQREKRTQVYLVGVFLRSVDSKLIDKWGEFVPEWNVIDLLKEMDISELTDMQKRVLFSKFGEYVGVSVAHVAKGLNVTRGRITEVIQSAMSKLGLESRFKL